MISLPYLAGSNIERSCIGWVDGRREEIGSFLRLRYENKRMRFASGDSVLSSVYCCCNLGP